MLTIRAGAGLTVRKLVQCPAGALQCQARARSARLVRKLRVFLQKLGFTLVTMAHDAPMMSGMDTYTSKGDYMTYPPGALVMAQFSARESYRGRIVEYIPSKWAGEPEYRVNLDCSGRVVRVLACQVGPVNPSY